MLLFRKGDQLQDWLEKQRSAGRSIGFIPTMGALHKGHISLLGQARKAGQLIICSIFVNPTQFNDPRDFKKYPSSIEQDILLLEKAGTDVLYLPGVEDIYPQGMTGLERYDLGDIETVLEGKYRPGHFQGVCQVVRRLLDRVHPDHLYMGQKDYQQCLVLRRLLTIMGSAAKLHICPIVRETDGLAMSSRNRRLSPEQREKAPAIYQALSLLKAQWEKDKAQDMAPALLILEMAGFRTDYIVIADTGTLQPLNPAKAPTGKAIALIAAYLGEIRLIDNLILDED